MTRGPGEGIAWLRRVAAEETDECQVCPYGGPGRYGKISHQGKIWGAHVLALHLDGRPPGPGQEARHLCGTSRCCNPRHLKPGTHAENEADKVDHGTLANRCGEEHHAARLTEDDVRAIRASSDSQRVLAARHGVSKRTIRRVQQGLAWRHVA